MFKSVFSRMLAAFTVILLLCITLLVFVVASGLFQESQEKELSELGVAANEIGFFLEEMQRISALPAPLLLQSESFHSNLVGIADLTEADISVLRMDGVVAATSNDRWRVGEQMLKEDTVERIMENDSTYIVSDLDGILDRRQLNSFAIIGDSKGSAVYLIVVTSEKALNSDIANSVTQRMVVVAIWIFFAAMIIIFLISRRITDSIKTLCSVAREYAQGRFNIRIKVNGQDEITELSTAFNNMASGLAKLEENRNTFIANVSHDLRSPMTSIAGFVDGILDGVIPPEKHEHYLRIVSTEVKRLSRLVATLLDISRIQAGERKFTMAPFDICEMGRQILLSFEQKINDKRLEVFFDCDEDKMMVLADRDAIHQIFYNLCDNAVKFASEGGEFRIVIRKQKNHKLLVSVYNEGQGISDADLPYVFERFYKSDKSRGLNKSGVGLGLFIAKTIVEAHGEHIWVESEFGKSCSFNFTLPIE